MTDELIRRFRLDSGDDLRIAVLAIDPTRRKTGGALLGDRIRMNAIYHRNIFVRSLATRGAGGEVPECLTDVIRAIRCYDFDLIIVETPGIGQGDAGLVSYVDQLVYVMTPEFGAQSQLEKIDMLDFADLVIINKFDRRGAEDAYRDVCKQVQRNRTAFDRSPAQMPVFGTIASHFNDDGVTAAYQELVDTLRDKGLRTYESRLPKITVRTSSEKAALVPADRQRYLADIAATVRAYHAHAGQQAVLARECQQLSASREILLASQAGIDDTSRNTFDTLIRQRQQQLDSTSTELLQSWPDRRRQYLGEERVEQRADGREVRTRLVTKSLSGTLIPRIALPGFSEHGELLRWLMRENLPGFFPLYRRCVSAQARGRRSRAHVCR